MTVVSVRNGLDTDEVLQHAIRLLCCVSFRKAIRSRVFFFVQMFFHVCFAVLVSLRFACCSSYAFVIDGSGATLLAPGTRAIRYDGIAIRFCPKLRRIFVNEFSFETRSVFPYLA